MSTGIEGVITGIEGIITGIEGMSSGIEGVSVAYCCDNELFFLLFMFCQPERIAIYPYRTGKTTSVFVTNSVYLQG